MMTECQQAHADLMSAIESVIANGHIDSEIAFIDVAKVAALHRAYEQYMHTPIMPLVD
jgi:hypothetical protein